MCTTPINESVRALVSFECASYSITISVTASFLFETDNVVSFCYAHDVQLVFASSSAKHPFGEHDAIVSER